MGPNNTAKNLRNFYYWFIPIIIAAKIVRWTVMYYKLVVMSIGNGMAMRMYFGMYSFRMSVLSQTSNISSVAESNAGALFRAINFFNCIFIDEWEIYISIIYNIIALLIVRDFYKRTPQAGIKENIFVYLGVAILNIFCFCLSKEPYQMLFFILMALAIIKGKTYQLPDRFILQKILWLSTSILFLSSVYRPLFL